MQLYIDSQKNPRISTTSISMLINCLSITPRDNQYLSRTSHTFTQTADSGPALISASRRPPSATNYHPQSATLFANPLRASKAVFAAGKPVSIVAVRGSSSYEESIVVELTPCRNYASLRSRTGVHQERVALKKTPYSDHAGKAHHTVAREAQCGSQINDLDYSPQ